MGRTIVVLNPNSSVEVTNGIDQAVACYRRAGGPLITCERIAAAPRGIESCADIDFVSPLVVERIVGDGGTGAFVVACFSDPGVTEARRRSAVPVFGIAESAYRAAAAGERNFGVISILDASIARHRRHIDSLGLLPYLIADRALNMGVAELAGGEEVYARLLEIGRQMVEADGVEAIVLGCAGMAPYSERLNAELGVAVIEPCRVATAEALQMLDG